MQASADRSWAQLIRYLITGCFNTLFGYSLYAFLNWLLTGRVPYGYMWASLLSNLIAISAAFLAYKWFVFKTRGHYLREWLRCLGVYGSSMLLSLLALPFLVALFRRLLPRPEAAPYVAGAVVTLTTIVVSFFGHKHFSFRRAPAGENPPT
jgi:putative flippase GtrA